ncbi:hypothetical protein [Streptomyces sp. NPDC051211]|uniref:hypothetical protein n=1 Tax=Streptomyces sp. NPDC051211 TaxID=3154643 RepID=UPI003450A9B1
MTTPRPVSAAPAAPASAPRPPRRPGRGRILAAGCAALVVGAVFLAAPSVSAWWDRVLSGEPYPDADPYAEVARLKSEAQRAYDAAALPESIVLEASGAGTGSSCPYRGLAGLKHIDGVRTDVNGHETRWMAVGVTEADARPALARYRRILEADGWLQVREEDRRNGDFASVGFRFENPRTGDLSDVDWSSSRGAFVVTGYSDCVRPTGAYQPDPDWSPRRPS